MIDLGVINPVAILLSLMAAATPILLAAIGELVVEKSGVLNLGVEGMMIIGAVVGFVIAIETESLWLAFVLAAVAGAMMALIFALLTQFLLSNQVASGLALTMFGLGLSAMIGHGYTGMKPPALPKGDFGGAWNILLGHDVIVYFSLLLLAVVHYGLFSTRFGLVLRAVGEDHHAAHSLGYRVVLVRVCCLVFGGMCAGLGGAYLSLVRVPQWTEEMTAGVGWIALAIVVFASWQPWRLLLGAYLFGGVLILQLNLQAMGIALNVAFLSMAPYLVTIIVLVMMSARVGLKQAPKSLGKVFYHG